ncbi:multicopper oxidase domain-containing protein [Listeria fleischmannii]|uniref:multicopper oxidase domain-containing protein n=1 Tax=Listeria fleischmannii TaxID=1069827 RepID=UPI0035DB6F63
MAKEKGQTLELKDGNTNVLTFKIANSLLLGPPLPKELGTKKATKDLATDKVEKIELSGMGTMVRIDGKKFDKNRIDKVAKQGEEQIFEITNKDDMMGGMNHPFHIHGTQFQIVSRNGKEVADNERGLKDTVLIAPNEKVQIKIRFTQKGLFVYHCHNLEHEENGMMGQINVI